MSWPEQVATIPLHLHSPPRHKSLAMAGTIMATKTKKLSTDNILTLPQLAPDQLARGGICQRSRGRLGLPGFDRRRLSFGGLSTGLPMIPHTQIASSIELKLSHFSGYVPLILLNKCSPSCIP